MVTGAARQAALSLRPSASQVRPTSVVTVPPIHSLHIPPLGPRPIGQPPSRGSAAQTQTGEEPRSFRASFGPLAAGLLAGLSTVVRRRTSGPILSPVAAAAVSVTGEAEHSGVRRNLQLAGECLRSSIFLVLLYGWFFKSVHFLHQFVDQYPNLHVIVYFALATIPMLCLRYRIFRPSLLIAVSKSDILTGSIVRKHLLRCALTAIDFSIQALLVFFASNLLLDAVPEENIIGLPKAWHFLHSDVITGQQLQDWFRDWSAGFLRAALCSLGVWFALAVKTPPEHLVVRASINPVVRYWGALLRGRGPAIVLDLGLSILISSVAWLEWLRFFGIKPETVLTFGGAGGLALGFASQRVVGNLVSGLLLLITQPFTVGDEIQTKDRRGVVKDINWSSTVIEAEDGGIVLIPNQSIVGAETTNLSLSNTRALQLTLPIVMPNTLEAGTQALKAVEAALEAHEPLRCVRLDEPIAFYDFPHKNPHPVLNVEVNLDGRKVDSGALALLKSSVILTVIDVLQKQGVQVSGTAGPESARGSH